MDRQLEAWETNDPGAYVTLTAGDGLVTLWAKPGGVLVRAEWGSPREGVDLNFYTEPLTPISWRFTGARRARRVRQRLREAQR